MIPTAPLSQPNVATSSTDTLDTSIITLAWLTSPTDQQVAVAPYKRIRQAFASKSMQFFLSDSTECWQGFYCSLTPRFLRRFGTLR